MTVALETWQKRLEGHFSSLAAEKAAHGHVVYAIEHGLEPSEVDDLNAALSEHLDTTKYLDPANWIVWIVAAAEIGYQYDGDEYWATFSERFPAWPAFGNRSQIRSWFRQFAAKFHGFRPSGRWADHFSIISWPIGHSILPRYLQSLFATHLHSLRFELARADVTSQEQVGELLRGRYHGGSSRFEDLLEQTGLTGRLVLALRDEDIQGAEAPVYKQTLSRIVSDLEALRPVRSRFRDTRRVLRDARIRATRNLRSGGGDAEGARTPGASGSISPVRLIARQLSDGCWKLGVALPDLTAELEAAGVSLTTLDRLRIRFFDRSDYWMPGRNLGAYYSGRDQALARLPDPIDCPLLVLDREIAPVSALVSSRLRISGTGPWLLRVQGDGAARQVLGRHVRTGATYLVITQTPIPIDLARSLELETVELGTDSAFAYRLEVPRGLVADQLATLKKLDLGYALRARVEPVGLVPRWEGSDDSSTWLTTEEVLLRLSSDFPVRNFWVSIDGANAVRIPTGAGQNAIIAVEDLDSGSHSLSVLAEAPDLSGGSLLEPEVLQLRVRAPRPWISDVTRNAGFSVTLDPFNAPLERLVSGRATLSVIGPAGRTVHAQVSLSDASGHVVERADLGHIKLPAEKSAVHRLVNKLAEEPLSEKVEGAPHIGLSFAVDELGVSSVSFPHKVQPLRWKLEHNSDGYRIRLIDEAGADEEVSVFRFPITAPNRRVKVGLEECLKGAPVEPPGALYVAKLGKRVFPIVVSVPAKERITSFADLAAPTSLERSLYATANIPKIVARYRLWRAARSLGPLGALRKATVLTAFEQCICEIVCGAEWADRARKSLNGQRHLVNRLRKDLGGSPGFGARICSTDWGGYPQFSDAVAEFARIAEVYGVCGNARLSDFALRLAFHPQSVRFDYPGLPSDLFEQIAINQQLLKGAFLTRLVSDLAIRDAIAEQQGA